VGYAPIRDALQKAAAGSARQRQGIRSHQKVQRSRPEGYSAEVTVSYTTETDNFILEVNGRIDGIFDHENTPVIEEIKSTHRDLESPQFDENELHWGQAKCYAYMYALEKGHEDINVQLTYCHVESGATREIIHTFTTKSLRLFFDRLVAEYLEWADGVFAWTALRDHTIAGLEFPFAQYRPGQRRMAAEIYRTIRDSGQIIVQAPPGIGKTIASIFPALKAMGEGHIEKIFYLTARTTGRMVAENTFAILGENHLKLKTITLTAKDKTCFLPDAACSGKECIYAEGYYDRIGTAVNETLLNDQITRDVIENAAREHRVCPFEFSLDISLQADCIICDYNYAFDPKVFLKRFFAEKRHRYAFLIDETHNLVDRAREMFSAELSKQQLLDVRRMIKADLPTVYKAIGKINTWMLSAKKNIQSGGFLAEGTPPETLYPVLKDFTKIMDRRVSGSIKSTFRKELLDLYFTVTSFLRCADTYDEKFSTIYALEGRDLKLKLYCLDPSTRLEQALDRSESVVFFSATITPADYFRKILGIREEAKSLLLPSPFPADRLCVLVAGKISTYYSDRDTTKHEIARHIQAMVNTRKGNYLVFFPSYHYMTAVHDIFLEAAHDMDVIIQSRDMSEEARSDFVARFKEDTERTLTGFAVMGGVFGEGIDLVGDRLTGAVIIGVGLPGISPERDLIRSHFGKKDGFLFAYLYPGINKVLQATGRVIRSSQDRGAVLLIDKRFSSHQYGLLFPDEWKPLTIKDDSQLQHTLQKFWYKK